MPRPRPPYLHRQRTRHGSFVWYVRRGKGKRIRIYEDFGTPAFMEAYEAALRGEARKPSDPTAASGTFSWLVESYMRSSDWFGLSESTRAARTVIFRGIEAASGAEPVAKFTPLAVQRSLDRRADKPFAAVNFLKTLRGLFRWAVKVEHIKTDPTAAITFSVPKTDGFHPWSDAEVDQFEAAYPLGTRERVALAILLYSGLRRGDAARVGPKHVSELVIKEDDKPDRTIKVISITTEKTGTEVVIPILPVLQAALDAGPLGTETFISRANGKPYVKESFGNWFSERARAAGCPGSAHGLRKTGATRAAERGATERQLNAIYGWADGSSESKTYTKKADRRRLARDAIEKLAG